MSIAEIYARQTKSSLKCPNCGSRFNGRSDSRRTTNGFTVKRRNYCTSCNFRWSTFENAHITAATYHAGTAEQCYQRWIKVHDIRAMGKRAVEETA